jgi:hypothetical protein
MREPIISEIPYGLIIQLDHEWLSKNGIQFTFLPEYMKNNDYDLELNCKEEEKMIEWQKRINEKII